jgi:hypothetical protein
MIVGQDAHDALIATVISTVVLARPAGGTSLLGNIIRPSRALIIFLSKLMVAKSNLFLIPRRLPSVITHPTTS